MDEAAVAFGGAFGWRSVSDGAKEFALFGGFAAGFLALFGLAVEGLGDGGGTALLAEGEDLDCKFAAFVFDVEHVADVDLAGWLGGVGVRENAVHVAGFGGLLAGLEEAGGPKPLVDAGSGHVFIFAAAPAREGLDGAEHAAGKGEERGDELEDAADYDTDEAEGQEDQPDQRIEDKGCDGQGPAKEGEKTEEDEVEHRIPFLEG